MAFFGCCAWCPLASYSEILRRPVKKETLPKKVNDLPIVGT